MNDIINKASKSIMNQSNLMICYETQISIIIFPRTLCNMLVQLRDNDKNNRRTEEEVLFNVLPHGRF